MALWMGHPYHICAIILMLGIATLWHIRLHEPSMLFWSVRLLFLGLLLPFSFWHYEFGLCLPILGFCGRG